MSSKYLKIIAFILIGMASLAEAASPCVTALSARDSLRSLAGRSFDFKFAPDSPVFQLRFSAFSKTPNWLGGPDEEFSAVITTSHAPDRPPYVVALVSSLSASRTNRFHLGWLLRTRYDTVFDRINALQKSSPEKTKFEILSRLARNATSSTNEQWQIGIQCEFILAELRRFHRELPTPWGERVWRRLGRASELAPTDDEMNRYFENAPSINQYRGIGFAMLEKVATVLPLGSEIDFDIANVVTNRRLSQGGTWDRTLLGRYAAAAGFTLEDLISQPNVRTAILTKTREATPVFFRE